MVRAEALERLLGHIPASRRAMVKDAIFSEEYIAPAMISLPLEEFERLLAATESITTEAQPSLTH